MTHAGKDVKFPARPPGLHRKGFAIAEKVCEMPGNYEPVNQIFPLKYEAYNESLLSMKKVR
jgi:hypothetical protein